MRSLPAEIKKELTDFRKTQQMLLKHYVAEQNNEMAYLVRWSILEKVVKSIATENRRQLLIDSLHEWLDHLKKGTPRPARQPKINMELQTLPHEKEFIACLEWFGLSGESIWSVMKSGGRYRNRRNALAHTGIKFVKMATYESLCTGLDEITNAIFQEIESNKNISPKVAKQRR